MANESLRRKLSKVGRVTKSNKPDVLRFDGGGEQQPTTIDATDRVTDDVNTDIDDEPATASISDTITIDPNELDEYIARDTAAGTGNNNAGNDNTRKRRQRSDTGQQRGYTRRKKETPQDISAFVTMAHTWAAVLLKIPELNMDESDAKKLSDAYKTFAEYHEVPVLTPKRVSEINMIVALLAVEGTRMVAVYRRKKQENMEHKIHAVPTQQNVSHSPIVN